MANKNLFGSNPSRGPATDTVNEAGGRAYAFGPKHALAQYAVTGCLNGTYYADAETQLETVLDLAKQVVATDPAFVGQVAIYAREKGFMKDMPALLVAFLAAKAPVVFKQVFPRVIDDVKMLRNFVQIVRSGVTGRKSLGTSPKKAVQKFFDEISDTDLFRQSIGNDPSLADVIKMVHPKPKTESRRNLYAYLLGKKFDSALLPEDVQAFEKFKANPKGAPPAINFQFLSSIKMSADQWSTLAGNMSWHSLRMNLNTLQRNGVFEEKGMDTIVAKKLADADTIRKVKAFPYQLMMAYMNADSVPTKVRNALQSALEVATENTPVLPGKVVVAVDTSGSMSSAVTGNRGTATSKVRCIDVAALMASSIMRRNEDAEIMPFDTVVHHVRGGLNGRDSIMTNATKLAGYGGGGTDCAAVLRKLNDDKTKADAVIYLSDNESWVQSQPTGGGRYGHNPATNMYTEWRKFKARNPNAKLVCIDLTPHASTQVPDDKNVLNVGGFNDRVFDVVNLFLRGDGGEHWVEVIESIELT